MKAKMILAGALLFFAGCLLGAGSVYMYATGTRVGGALLGLFACCALIVGFFLAASEDPYDAGA